MPEVSQIFAVEMGQSNGVSILIHFRSTLETPGVHLVSVDMDQSNFRGVRLR